MISILASVGIAYCPVAFGGRTTYSSGGQEGVQVMQAIESAQNDLRKTHTFGVRDRILTILRTDLIRRYGVDGWNGYDAKAVINESIEHAISFVNEMPLEIKDPKVRVVPDGGVSFSWRNANGRVCTVVFDVDGRYHCASIIGEKEMAITTNSKEEIFTKAMEVFA